MPMLKQPGRFEKKQASPKPKPKKKSKLAKAVKKSLGRALVDGAKATWEALNYEEKIE